MKILNFQSKEGGLIYIAALNKYQLEEVLKIESRKVLKMCARKHPKRVEILSNIICNTVASFTGDKMFFDINSREYFEESVIEWRIDQSERIELLENNEIRPKLQDAVALFIYYEKGELFAKMQLDIEEDFNAHKLQIPNKNINGWNEFFILDTIIYDGESKKIEWIFYGGTHHFKIMNIKISEYDKKLKLDVDRNCIAKECCTISLEDVLLRLFDYISS